MKISQEIRLLSTRKLYEMHGKIGVVAEFTSGDEVKAIFKNTKNLAGSKIIVERDLTTEKQQDKRVMLQLKKCIMEVSNEKMKIGAKWFLRNRNKNLVCGNQDVNFVLENLYGSGIKSVNLNYNDILSNLFPKNK